MSRNLEEKNILLNRILERDEFLVSFSKNNDYKDKNYQRNDRTFNLNKNVTQNNKNKKSSQISSTIAKDQILTGIKI